MRRAISMVLAAGCFAGAAAPAGAIDLMIDYTHDTWFAGNPTAKAALEAAALDLSAAMTSALNPTSATDTGVNGATTATFTHRFNYTNPATGGSEVYTPTTLNADEVIIFAGLRPQPGNAAGTGGPGAYGFSISVSGFASEVPGAIDAAELEATANLTRGGGPVIGQLDSNLSFFSGQVQTTSSIGFGSTIGKISFDNDTDNSGGIDTPGQLASYWHFDHTTPVAPGKVDFYSVALHELIHAVGFGASQSWDLQVDPMDSRDWLGAAVIDLLGSGENVLEADANHITYGTISTHYQTGLPQEAALDPDITVGDRKFLTALDLAFLRDIGWDTIDPLFLTGDLDRDGSVLQDDLDLLLADWKQSGDLRADLNGDLYVDDRDLGLLLGGWTGGDGVVAVIPEPGGAGMLLAVTSWMLARRTRRTPRRFVLGI